MAAPIDDALIEVVVPVYNEERALEPNVRALAAHLDRHLPVRWRVVIADNASTDATPAVAAALAASSPSIDYLRLEQKGRGGHCGQPGRPARPTS